MKLYKLKLSVLYNLYIWNIYFLTQNIATKLSEISKFEDSLRKNNILPDPDKKLYDKCTFKIKFFFF